MAARKRKPPPKPLPPSRALAQSKEGRRSRGLARLDMWLPELVLVALEVEAEALGTTRAALILATLTGRVRARIEREIAG